MSDSTSTAPTLNGAVAGAVSGLVIFIVIVLIDHFIFSGAETAEYGFWPTLVGAAIVGVVFGAAVGLVVALTQSMPTGIAAGAVLFAGLKITTAGLAGGFGVLAAVMGLIYGAIFGWAVASSVVKSLEAAEA